MKLLIVVAIYLFLAYIVTAGLIIFSVVFFLFGIGDPLGLFTTATYIFFFAVVAQVLIIRYVYKRL